MAHEFTPSRRTVTLLGAAAFGLALGGAPRLIGPVRAQERPASGAGSGDLAYQSWFKLVGGAEEQWRIVPTPGNTLEVRVLAREAQRAAPAKKVLVVYPRPSSAYDIAISRILSVFAGRLLPVELTAVNFQTDDARGHAVLRQAHDGNFDLILAMGSESAAWLWDNYKGGRLPVVTVCSKDPVMLGQAAAYDRGSRTNFAFTSLNMPIDVQMAYVAELKPGLKSIAVIADAANVSAVETQMKPVADYARARGLAVLELYVRNAAKAREELAVLVKDAAATMAARDPGLGSSVFWITGSTSVFREIATINAHAGGAAVLSAVPDIVRGGDESAMMSIGISFESNAQLAALYASDVLTGRSQVGQMKVGVVTPPDMSINFRKVREVGASIPLSMFAAAGTIFDYEGNLVRLDGKPTLQAGR
jgi:putative ABC transport system substrate-binding protein